MLCGVSNPDTGSTGKEHDLVDWFSRFGEDNLLPANRSPELSDGQAHHLCND